MTLHPSLHARTTPDKIAYCIAGTGAAITYAELERRSNQGAQLFRSLGLRPQDHIALLAENSLRFLEICWAAQRCGLYYTAISTYLTAGEIAYIVADCGAKVFISTERLADIAGEAPQTIPAAALSRQRAGAERRRNRTLFHATATASCHRAAASALKIRSVSGAGF